MQSRILLKPMDSLDTYLVLSGEPSIKDVGGEKRAVTPISAARFMEPNILDNPPSDPVIFMYDNGYKLEEKIHLPIAMSPLGATVEMYRRGDLVVLSTDSDPLIDSYRALQIFGALPSINGKNLGEIRDAENFIRDHYRFQEHGPSGRWNKLKARIGFGSELPESAKKYEGKVDRTDLVTILQSSPTDTKGNRLVAGGKTNLVIASAALPEDELADLLEHPGLLDPLSKCDSQTNYGIVTGVRLLDTPAIISASQDVRQGQTPEELSSPKWYEDSALY